MRMFSSTDGPSIYSFLAQFYCGSIAALFDQYTWGPSIFDLQGVGLLKPTSSVVAVLSVFCPNNYFRCPFIRERIMGGAKT